MNWQERSTEFAQKHNLSHTAGVYLLDLVCEIGEVAKELLLQSDYGARAPGGRMGDVVYSMCMLADAAGINLDTALRHTRENTRPAGATRDISAAHPRKKAKQPSRKLITASRKVMERKYE